VLPILLALLAAEGRPLFYWGARPPVIVTGPAERAEAGGVEARVREVHAAADGDDLVLRLTFDRPVREAMYVGGAPASGRLRAVIYLDDDDDRTTGLDEGAMDLRTGAERRLELGVLAMGADPDEKREASAVLSATLHALSREGRRRTLWRADDAASPERVSARGEWVEIRMPGARPRTRIVLTGGGHAWDGRLPVAR
jgi:hypothetical protein